MGEGSKIEWTDHTFNPWVGCTKISPGCDHCYAEGWAKRSGRVVWGGERRRTTEAYWRQPLKWNAEAQRTGVRARVFCASLADVFDNDVPGEWRSDLGALIRATPNLDWLLLTKRIGNVCRMLPEDWGDGYPNVWLGITVVNQEEADRDIPKLLQIPARVRFLSCEPLLGPVGLASSRGGTLWMGGQRGCGGVHRGVGTPECPTEPHHHHDDRCGRGLDWVIVGGESGYGARPFVLGWGNDIVRQCREAAVPVFVKQVGANPVNREGERCPNIRDPKGKVMEEWPEELRVRQFPTAARATA